MAAVIVGCPPVAYAVESAVDVVLRRNDLEELSKGNIFEDIILKHGGVLCDAEEAEEHRDPNDAAEVERIENSDEDMGTF